MATAAQRAATAERRKKAIQARISGLDWRTIAERLGYSDAGAACKDVSRALAANQKAAEKAGEDYRALELARLDRMQAALWPDVLKGDVKAVDTTLRLMQRRARLLGLDDLRDAGASQVMSLLETIGRGLTARYGTGDDEHGGTE